MSTFTDFRDKPNTKKIALVEIDIPESPAFWLPYEAGLWRFNMVDAADDVTFNFQNGLFTQGAFGTSGVADLGLNGANKLVGSLKVNYVEYTEVITIADLRSTDKSFLYDLSGDRILYVHFESFEPPSSFPTIEAGVANGYSTQEIYLSNNLYEGRVESIPQISMERDPLFFGLITFGGGSITLRNNDGEFDSWKDENIYGQAVRIKFGGDSLVLSDYYTLFTGFLEDYAIGTESIVIDINDDRKRFTRNLPVNIFDLATYPNIKDRNVNRGIPIAYGTVTNAPVMCIDEAAGSSEASYNFVICDTTYHGINAINQIYIASVPVTAASSSLTAGTFVLTGGSSETTYEPGNAVTADFEGMASGGSLISNGLDIITDILDHYIDKPFNASIYDTTEWASAQAVARNCAQWIASKKSIVDVIEDLSVANFGNFIVLPDGKYTFRTIDFDRATAGSIIKEQQLTMPGVVFDSSQFLSSVIVNYDKDQKENDFIEYPDTTREATVFTTYGTRREKEFDTVITNATDAASFGTAVMDLSEEIPTVFRTTTKTQFVDLVLMDNIALQVDRVGSTWYGTRKVEVIGITYNMDEFRVDLTCRDIEGLEPGTVTTFMGDWTIDAPVFSTALGSGSADTWDRNWTAAQKVYALQNFGYWTDDDGYIDSSDPDSYQVSNWDED